MAIENQKFQCAFWMHLIDDKGDCMAKEVAKRFAQYVGVAIIAVALSYGCSL
jgi:hypothetical protein